MKKSELTLTGSVRCIDPNRVTEFYNILFNLMVQFEITKVDIALVPKTIKNDTIVIPNDIKKLTGITAGEVKI